LPVLPSFSLASANVTAATAAIAVAANATTAPGLTAATTPFIAISTTLLMQEKHTFRPSNNANDALKTHV
jgi:hypothetical protein